MPLRALEMLSTEERDTLLQCWQGTVTAKPEVSQLQGFFEVQAKANPEATALVWEETELTYGELNAQANQLAQYLRAQNQGVGDYVGVYLSRGPALAIAILATLKAGCAYVPLDPSYPLSRLDFVIADTGLDMLLTESALSGRLTLSEHVHPILLDEASVKTAIQAASNEQPVLLPQQQAGALAYIIYTSGSTGQPKGVMIRHSNAMALMDWSRRYFSAAELSSVLACTSVNFDLSVFELFAPLSTGGRVVMVDNILSLLTARPEVSLINTVPSGIKTLLSEGLPELTMTVCLAGEPLPMATVNQLHHDYSLTRVVNLYGPSEDTTYSTASAFDGVITAEPDIGYPIDNTKAYVIGIDQQLSPLGAVGELYIGGAGLAQGYLNRPDL
ncbi:AMP-binding protein, partial [Pseudoalteromonas sp. P1-9]|uniref:AMP-binding protein n=1 Tax=Pseudoalteromonas sp. P1-9 TaxID=1710354 RepID=UPI00128F2CF2